MRLRLLFVAGLLIVSLGLVVSGNQGVQPIGRTLLAVTLTLIGLEAILVGGYLLATGRLAPLPRWTSASIGSRGARQPSSLHMRFIGVGLVAIGLGALFTAGQLAFTIFH